MKQKKMFFSKKLLHSYLLLKGAQYFYTFAQNSTCFSQKSYSIAM